MTPLLAASATTFCLQHFQLLGIMKRFKTPVYGGHPAGSGEVPEWSNGAAC